MKILLSAFGCVPRGASEAGTGWAWAVALSRHHDVVALTDGTFRDELEAELAARPNPRLRFVYIGNGPRGFEGLAIYPYYYAWQRRAVEVARELHALHGFDVAHHVTIGAHRVPTWLWQLPIPLLWGPIGGGEDVPTRFYSPARLGAREATMEAVRRAWNLGCRMDPRLRQTARAARATGVTTAQTRDAFPRDARDRMLIMPKMGLEPGDLELLTAMRPQPGPTTGVSVAFVGRLLGWKGPAYALDAFARYAADHPTAELHFYGDGPARGRLEQRALPLGNRVRFHGFVSRDEVLAAYARHQALLFPSLHDSYPAVVLESMAAGLPVVCLDAGGVSVMVGEGNGMKVPVHSPEQAIRGLADALADLTRSPERWLEVSGRARAHALDTERTPSTEALARRLYGFAGLRWEPAAGPAADVEGEDGGRSQQRPRAESPARVSRDQAGPGGARRR